MTARSSRSARDSSRFDPLASILEVCPDFLERPRRLAFETEAHRRGHAAHPRLEMKEASASSRERSCLAVGVRLVSVDVLDQIAVEALLVADRRLEADDLHELEELTDALSGPLSLAISSTVGSRLSFCVKIRRERSILGDACSPRTCTGRRMVRPWSARARATAWRIHQVVRRKA